jgi:hypothetical protein
MYMNDHRQKQVLYESKHTFEGALVTISSVSVGDGVLGKGVNPDGAASVGASVSTPAGSIVGCRVITMSSTLSSLGGSVVVEGIGLGTRVTAIVGCSVFSTFPGVGEGVPIICAHVVSGNRRNSFIVNVYLDRSFRYRSMINLILRIEIFYSRVYLATGERLLLSDSAEKAVNASE